MKKESETAVVRQDKKHQLERWSKYFCWEPGLSRWRAATRSAQLGAPYLGLHQCTSCRIISSATREAFANEIWQERGLEVLFREDGAEVPWGEVDSGSIPVGPFELQAHGAGWFGRRTHRFVEMHWIFAYRLDWVFSGAEVAESKLVQAAEFPGFLTPAEAAELIKTAEKVGVVPEDSLPPSVRDVDKVHKRVALIPVFFL